MDSGTWRPQLGMRVRVRDGVGSIHVCDEVLHYPEEAGRIGVVRAARPLTGARRHTLLVRLDSPVPVVRVFGQDLSLETQYYSADELDPLDP